MALLWTCSKSSMSFLCWGPQNWREYSRVEGQNHLSHPAGHTSLNSTQDMAGLLSCKCISQIFHQLTLPNPSPHGCSQAILCPNCVCAWDCPDPSAGPCTWHCWTSWGWHGPTSQACLGSSGWNPFPLACQLHHSARCLLKTSWGFTQSHCLCHLQRCEITQVPASIPKECHSWPVSTWTLSCWLQISECDSQPIPYPVSDFFTSLGFTLLIFVFKD